MPQSFVKIAVPADSVGIWTHSQQRQMGYPPQLGNFQTLSCGSLREHGGTLRLKMSKGGIPLFVTQSKSAHFPGHDSIEDFLSASDVSGLPWKETDRRVKDETKAMRKSEFWMRVRQQAMFDRSRWISLQNVMARDSCIVDINFLDDWVDVAPKIQAQPLNLGAFRPSYSPLQQQVPSTQMQSVSSGRSRLSGLRNEFKW